MTELPEVRYARNGDVAIAFQVLGNGGVDLVFVPGFISNLDLMWEFPPYARFLHRLASFSRLIVMDRRGTGLSDRLSRPRPRARGVDGRSERGPARGRCRSRGAVRMLRFRGAVLAFRRNLSRTHERLGAVRAGRGRRCHEGLPVGVV